MSLSIRDLKIYIEPKTTPTTTTRYIGTKKNVDWVGRVVLFDGSKVVTAKTKRTRIEASGTPM